jgi:hypothetical protein
MVWHEVLRILDFELQVLNVAQTTGKSKTRDPQIDPGLLYQHASINVMQLPINQSTCNENVH